MPAAVEVHDHERLNEIKTVLRALLISNGKLDVTVPCLNGIFREEEGENIPFREFGYPSLQEFLLSMPDVVFLRYNRERQLCAYHVESEKSAHVSSLVSRQRKPQKKAKFNTSYKTPRSSYGNYCNYSRSSAQPSTMSTINALRQVLEELRQAPKCFQNDKGIRKSDILQKLQERPVKSSITSLQILNTKLKELSQYVVVDEDFVYLKEDVFSSSSNASSRQKLATCIYQNLEVRSAPNHHSMPRFETNQQANGCKPAINQPPQFVQVGKPIPTSHTSMPVSQMTNQSHKVPSMYVEQARKSSDIDSDEQTLKERIKFRLQKLIEKYPEGIWAVELPTYYWKEYNIELNYHDLGFNSITEFVATVPDILTITDPNDTGRHMILDARISLNIIENKQQTKTLASHYNFDDDLNDKEPIPSKLSSMVSRKFIPEGMMGQEETVEYISVGTLALKDYFEVNISEIFTPSFFWITLRKNKSKIKKLMDELDDFYKNQDLDTCRLPQVLAETGLNVACTYSNMWHRAIIQKVKSDGYIVVLFYDYGTIKTYSPNDLYYLHKKFSVLPAQAIACGLYNVKAPQDNEWPIENTNMFVNKVWGVPLIATVCETNENNNTMMITLTDTNESFDLHLNEWMIENGLAVRGKMVCIGNNFVLKHYKNCLANKLSSKKSRKKCIKILDEKNSEQLDVFINSHVDYHAKMTAIQKYRNMYCTSSESSSADEISFVCQNVSNDKQINHYSDSLFERYKQLNGKKCSYTKKISINLKQESTVRDDDDNDKIEKMTRRIMALKFPRNIQNTMENVISNISFDIDSFYGENGGHGRMDPIDWSAVKNN